MVTDVPNRQLTGAVVGDFWSIVSLEGYLNKATLTSTKERETINHWDINY